MKKFILLLALLTVFVFAGCSAAAPGGPSADIQPSDSALPSESAQDPNVWVVREQAPLLDADTGKEAGTVYPGFALAVQNEKDGKAGFSLNFLEKGGEKAARTQNYFIGTKYMEKKYVEPQAVILMISVDMFTLKAGGSFYNEKGEKLITFNDAVGPFHFIEKTDKGYMMTIDFNVVYAKEADAEYITVAMPQ